LDGSQARAWALYDWANSAALTTIVAAVFPVYFARVACADLPPGSATERLAAATSAGLLVSAILAPWLGALADLAAIRKKLLVVFLVLGVCDSGSLFFVGRGDWLLGALLFALVNIGASGSFVFYDALLPHVAPKDKLDALSTSGYALGYLGGGLLLALNVAWILRPQSFGLPSGEGLAESAATLPTRLAFLSVALWWLAFSLPLVLRVHEPSSPQPRARFGAALAGSWRRLVSTLRELHRFRHAFWMLLAFLIYNDGIATIIRLAVVYGEERKLPQTALLGAILLVQFAGVPFAFGFGWLASRIGPKPAILAGLIVYAAICLFALRMDTELDFYLLALLVALVQGGTQALSRSLFASLIPKQRSAEFFGLFAVLEKFAGVAGPTVFLVVRRATDSSSLGVAAIFAFFVVGGAVLLLVDVEEGRRVARAAEGA
jgi:UMF1 family MFS transporter